MQGQTTRSGLPKWAIFDDGLCVASGTQSEMESQILRLNPHYATPSRIAEHNRTWRGSIKDRV
jgi:hypothetical protein